MNDVIAIIPARAGSKSVVDKNIADLGGYPLLAYSIAVAKLSKNISDVWVSTDSEEYAIIAKQFGAKVPFIRPEKYACDESTDQGFLIHAMDWAKDNLDTCPEYWVHLRPTTPLRTSVLVDSAIEAIKQKCSCTSLRSAHKAPESPLKWFTKDSSGYYRGLIEQKNSEFEQFNLPKEAFEQVYIPDGYVDIVKASHVLNNPSIHGESILGFQSPVCTEVDSLQELNYIRFQLQQNGSELLSYLTKIK